VQGIVFDAAGTAGQRCTTLRRLIVHRDIAETLIARPTAAYEMPPVGDPFDETTLAGPLISTEAFEGMQDAVTRAQAQGGKILAGGNRRLADAAPQAIGRGQAAGAP
jgi:aldehyde dehydrogenase (NAD+)